VLIAWYVEGGGRRGGRREREEGGERRQSHAMLQDFRWIQD
jgi:hypothetical protein